MTVISDLSNLTLFKRLLKPEHFAYPFPYSSNFIRSQNVRNVGLYEI